MICRETMLFKNLADKDIYVHMLQEKKKRKIYREEANYEREGSIYSVQTWQEYTRTQMCRVSRIYEEEPSHIHIPAL